MMKALRRILIGCLAVVAISAGGFYLFHPASWTIGAATESKLRRLLQLPAGYQINRYAIGLGTPRLMRWTKGGDLLVSIPRKGEVALIGRDADKSGNGGPIRALMTGLNQPHGLEIHDGYLYVAEQDAILRVPFDEEKGELAGKPEHILTGLPGGGNHWTRTLRMGPDGWMYVSVGSSCNACIEKDPRRAAILRFKPDGTGEEIFATGLRNTVGFDFDSKGRLWGVDNGRDMLGDDIPPEELNLIEKGKFYGWPYRYGDNVPTPNSARPTTRAPRRRCRPPSSFPLTWRRSRSAF
jgi:glucose/arabinose dehydrogenase